MSKTIFLAGASGAIGQPLSRILVSAGYKVYGSTLDEAKVPILKEMGVEPVVMNVYEAERLKEILAEIKPEIVINQLTDLPYGLDADKMAEALIRTARIRTEGTKNMIEAAKAAGVKRYIAQSISFIYDEGPLPHVESDPLLPSSHEPYGGTADGVRGLEKQVIESGLEALVLRFGLLYGSGSGFDAPIAPASVHVEAAAKAAAIAVIKGETGIYNVAEAHESLSTEKALSTFGWNPDWRINS
ncbi:NAD-dependent epimerase/dehydratase family protein [Sunxiuqinia sp. A32]|uniref:NAD-dependent epimerase/dehydratase family protein n=1 Tax=Sunxiuqinia sp. A32 TaxID=3461496 RepID=UPI0040463472